MAISLRVTRSSSIFQAFRRCGQSLLPPQTRAITTRNTRHTLNNGAAIPALGFGTFQDANAQEDAVSKCLKAGFRLIDTAQVYDVEREVGRGIKKSGVPREEVFLGTKLWCNTFHPDDVEGALESSLEALDTPYVDLLMMHYPCVFARGEERFPRDANGKMILGKTTYVDTWKAMEKLLKTGKVKAIGVSNFSRGEIQTLLDQCSVVRHVYTYPRNAPCFALLIKSLRLLPYIRWRPTPTFNRRTLMGGSSQKGST